MKIILSLFLLVFALNGCDGKTEKEKKAEAMSKSMSSDPIVGKGKFLPGTEQ